ncbi:MAG: homocysteine S-methyltransferase family protein [Planctomycetota bacterium]|jgi:S-methylmethionine-dependent homocysteine/selenocysteine methylase
MAQYRDKLPQLSGDLFLTDGGLETTLIFHEGFELPAFAACGLVDDERGRETLRKYYGTYAAIARQHGAGFVLESPTWRASAEWGRQIGYTAEALVDLNRRSIELLEEIRDEFQGERTRVVISGCVGPRRDAYCPDDFMTADEAQRYHAAQISTLAATAADMVAAFTMTYIEEAAGVTRAAQESGIPVAISFTVETDGRLPTGPTLREAIAQTDEATEGGPAYYMVNCAHPTHFEDALADGEPWLDRIGGIRANASSRSHAELDGSDDLDDGNPVELGRQYARLKRKMRNLSVLGGCCGTDHRHVEEICKACGEMFSASTG